jgi:hypothetical protein
MGNPDDSTSYISTYALARLINKNSKIVFVILETTGYLIKEKDQWQLTPLGENIGGKYGGLGGSAKHPVWPRTLAKSDLFIFYIDPSWWPCAFR